MSTLHEQIFSYKPKPNKPYNYREKLDLVLFALRNHNDEQRYSALLTTCNLRYNINISIPEFKRVLHKLEKDGFVLVENIDIYSITLDGYYFGGYVKKHKRDVIKYYQGQFQNWTLSIGTGLAGLYGLFEITKWCYHHFYWMHVLKFWQ
jgi:predicted transcriptional regulator